MLQLLERQVGADPHHIGFPSVQTCMAIVLLTDTGLFGWHSLNQGDGVTQTNAGRFANFIAANNPGLHQHLYLATNRGVHGGNWRTELQALAAGLNYHGPATSIDLKVNSEGVYVQFERQQGVNTCAIHYKRNSKMDYESAAGRMDPQAVRHRQLVLGGGMGFGFIPAGGDGKIKVYTTVSTNANSRKGKLNSVGSGQRDTITIP